MDAAENASESGLMLAAYHAAFAHELRSMVASLPIAEGARVLDLACGDGTYSRWLAMRSGGVWAVDPAVRAQTATDPTGSNDPASPRILFAAARLERLPFADATFDLAWCAQSFYSLPDPVGTLRLLARAVRPGGVVAVLESDTLHQVLLPWPIEVELALRSAELVGFAEESRKPGKFYVGRHLRPVFEVAGLVDIRRRTWAIDRQAPLDPPARAFLAAYLRDLRQRARPHLSANLAESADRYLDPDAPDYLPDRPDLAFTLIEQVVWACRPRESDQ